MATRIYLFDGDGVFTDEGYADPPPAPGEAEVIPWNATRTAPPSAPEGKAPVWNGGGWGLAPDFRGRRYWLADGTEHRIERVGEKIPGNAYLSRDAVPGARPPSQEPPAPTYVRRTQLAVAASQPPFQIITPDEAEDWATGSSLPLGVRTAIDNADLTDAQKLMAKIDARRAENIRGDHWLFVLVVEAFGMTPAEKSALIEAAKQIPGG